MTKSIKKPTATRSRVSLWPAEERTHFQGFLFLFVFCWRGKTEIVEILRQGGALAFLNREVQSGSKGAAAVLSRPPDPTSNYKLLSANTGDRCFISFEGNYIFWHILNQEQGFMSWCFFYLSAVPNCLSKFKNTNGSVKVNSTFGFKMWILLLVHRQNLIDWVWRCFLLFTFIEARC